MQSEIKKLQKGVWLEIDAEKFPLIQVMHLDGSGAIVYMESPTQPTAPYAISNQSWKGQCVYFVNVGKSSVWLLSKYNDATVTVTV